MTVPPTGVNQNFDRLADIDSFHTFALLSLTFVSSDLLTFFILYAWL